MFFQWEYTLCVVAAFTMADLADVSYFWTMHSATEPLPWIWFVICSQLVVSWSGGSIWSWEDHWFV